MSLYRTWRPKSFTDLVGQDAVVRTLRTALESGKLAHAYLFSGPRGSGKTSAAKILARCINCERGPTAEPDNSCENCRAMLAGTAMDVLELDAASNRGIDEIRAIRESVKFAPSSMRAKVYIIDEAHMLTREGANAFLKTLEEPPPHAVFILATTAPESLPATILSRCQRYAFRRIPVATMIERMREIANAEDIPIDDAALGAIAYRADGGLRDALTMLEQVAAFAGGPVDAATVDAAFGTTGRAYARTLVGAVLGGDAVTALRAVDEASDAGADMLGLVRASIAEYRNLLVARVDPDLLSRDLSASDASATESLAAETPQPKIVRGLRLLADALSAARLSGNPRLELETAVLRLAIVAEDTTLDALATRVALLEAGIGGYAQGLPGKAPASAVPATPAVAKHATPSPVAATRAAPPPVAERPSMPASEAEPKKVVQGEVAAPVRVEQAEGSAEPAPSPPAPQREAEPIPGNDAGPPTLNRVRSLWANIRGRAQDERNSLRAPLGRATVDAFADGVLTLGVLDQTMESFVRSHVKLIEKAASAVLDVPVKVVVRGSGSPLRTARADATSAAGEGTPALRAAANDAVPSSGITSDGDNDSDTDLLAYARRKIAPATSTGAPPR